MSSKVVTYVDYGRGPNWSDVIEEELNIPLDGTRPVFIRCIDKDEDLYLISNEPITENYSF